MRVVFEIIPFLDKMKFALQSSTYVSCLNLAFNSLLGLLVEGKVLINNKAFVLEVYSRYQNYCW